MIWMLIVYMMLYLHRPWEIWPALAPFQPERVFMIIMLVASLFSGKLNFRFEKTSLALIAFAFAVMVCFVASPFSGSDGCQKVIFEWPKILVFCLLLVALCNDRISLEYLLIGFVAATGLFVSHSVLEYNLGKHAWSMGVIRLQGINKAFEHPNSFGAIALVAMPCAFFVFRHGGRMLFKFGAVIYLMLASYGVILTSSRVGTFGLLLIAFFMFLKSTRKKRFLVAAAIVGVITWTQLPESRKNRIMSTFDSSYAVAGAEGSREHRIYCFWKGVELVQQFPITGAGPGAWQAVTGDHLVSHNLYGQLLGEVGLLGTSCFLFMTLVCLQQAFAIWKSGKSDNHLSTEERGFYRDIGTMFLQIVALLFFLGIAGGTLFIYYWYWSISLLIVAIAALGNSDLETRGIGTADNESAGIQNPIATAEVHG